ncbi:TetR/AcrR family transcriptional regulator [Streptomyces tateyamensis]|uniref:TetR/AcrR family transcriptional regulator n=1 Tax=Streptomyces tateyamensis TaxID=565073 RepID=A0A2V4NW60_9ACTN|nr:TetR/AcrR family transcriptional regulator [Streptomyces tateyamensis]PYC84725.1 TetR/AcrR family transcriptional regulator [Streptomyces tateyamensis]
MKLTVDRIVDAGMAVYAEAGYPGLSMRRVAARLDVHAGSLYYHVPNKAVLLRLMADRVAWQAYRAGAAALAALPGDAGWAERVVAQLGALRHTLRAHPGGAAMLADSPKVLSFGALNLMERLLVTLDEGRVPGLAAAVAADALLSHVTGFVLQEQGAAPAVPDASEAAAVHRDFPRTVAAAAAVSTDGRFELGLRLICAGAAAQIQPAPVERHALS